MTATRATIGRAVMREVATLMFAGSICGLAGTWAVGRVIDAFLFHISSHDPLALTVATLAMMGTAAAAATLPARRAARVDPLVTLKYE